MIYRACFAESRAKARQFVGHKFVKVNGRKVNVPSYLIKSGDEIQMVGTEDQVRAIKDTTKVLEDRYIVEWIDVTADNLAVKINRLPRKTDIGVEIEENLIVELYSK